MGFGIALALALGWGVLLIGVGAGLRTNDPIVIGILALIFGPLFLIGVILLARKQSFSYWVGACTILIPSLLSWAALLLTAWISRS